MKNFKPSMSFIASLALAAIVVVPVFAAGPFAAPPGNLVDAEFNSVTAVGSLSGASVTAVGDLKGATVQADTGYFANGVSAGTEGQTVTGGHFRGTSYGVTADALGASGIGGAFTGNLEGVHANTQGNGIAGVFVNFLNSDPNSIITRVRLAGPTSAVEASGNVKVTGNILATAANCPSCLAGIFRNASMANAVNLGTNVYSIDANGPVNITGNATVSGTITATGATINGNLIATKIKASSIGKLINQMGPAVILNNVGTFIAQASCPAPSIPISCGHYGSFSVITLASYVDLINKKCTLTFKSTTPGPNENAGAYAICWDTNSF
ncbi:MAG: hypothetical protein WC843_03315 [Candidatus Gracilibacteria bacterium]